MLRSNRFFNMHIQHLAAYSQGGAAVAARRLHKSLSRAVRRANFILALLRAVEEAGMNLFHGKEARPWNSETGSPVARYMQIKRKSDAISKDGRDTSAYLGVPTTTSWIESSSKPMSFITLDRTNHRSGIVVPIYSAAHAGSVDVPRHESHNRRLSSQRCMLGVMHGCGACPMLRDSHGVDLSRMVYQSKVRAIANHQVHAVTPSRWLERLVRNSAIMGNLASVNTIPTGSKHLACPYGFEPGEEKAGHTARRFRRRLQCCFACQQTQRN